MSNLKRSYRSELRHAKAERTKKSILAAARKTFLRDGFEKATIGRVAELAGVSAPLVYAQFKSKEGLLRALIDSTVFGADYNALVEKVTAQNDPFEALKMAAAITRFIYEGEVRQIGLIHRAAIVSAGLCRLERDLENQRYERQQVVVRRVLDGKAMRPGLGLKEARDIAWSLTSREIYRMLVHERGWTGDAYEAWLGNLLAHALLKPVA